MLEYHCMWYIYCQTGQCAKLVCTFAMQDLLFCPDFTVSPSRKMGPVGFLFLFTLTLLLNTRGKVLCWEYISPRKRNSRQPASVILCWVSWVENVLLIYYASSDLLVCFHWKSVCLHWKNPRFTFFLRSNLYTRLAIVTENELGLAFPPRNLPKKFLPDPSTFYLVIMVTNKQTDRQTNAGDYIIPRDSFREDN